MMANNHLPYSGVLRLAEKDGIRGDGKGDPLADTTALIARLTDELDMVKISGPLRAAELAIELQIERMRTKEIAGARDAALQRLSESYLSILQKNEIMDQMRAQIDGRCGSAEYISRSAQLLVEIEQLKAHIATLEATQDEMVISPGQIRIPNDPPPSYEAKKATCEHAGTQTDKHKEPTTKGATPSMLDKVQLTSSTASEDALTARYRVLASIPLPDNPPDATLTAIVIPPPFTIHDFLGSLPTSVKAILSNYRVLHEATTHWCPDREEHGYMYVPAYKCVTNPRITTAHRWLPNDVLDAMTRPTECFFNKDGIWYYAGLYRPFVMDELSPQEWEALAPETASHLVKETIAGRKNSSPQNTYETTQLYSVGALKIRCMGLQCIGFSQEVYNAVLDHSVRFNETKWRLGALNGGAHSTSAHSSPVVGSAPATPRVLGHSPSWSTTNLAVTDRSHKVVGPGTSPLLPLVSAGPLARQHCGIPPTGISTGLGLPTSIWGRDELTEIASAPITPKLETDNPSMWAAEKQWTHPRN